MYQFCGSEFWNKSLTWDASKRPDFTFCFEETVLLWVPCGLLYLLTLPSVISTILFTRKNKQISPKSYSINYKTDQESKTLTTIPWTVFSILKLLICLGFVIVSALELVAVLWLNNRDNLPLFSVHWVSPVIKIVIFVYLGFVFNFHRRNVVYSSGSIFVFVLLYTLYSGINIRSILISIFDDEAKYYPEFSRLYLICRIIATIFSVGLLLLVSTNEYNPDRKYDPNQTSGFLSKITFWWFTSIIIKGYRRPLVEDDTYNLASTNSSFEILEKFEHIVDKKQGVGSVKIAKLALQAYWKQLLGIAMLQLVATVLTFGNPYVMNLLITFLSSGTEEPLWRGFFYAALMFIFPMFLSLCSGQYEYWCNMISIRVKTGLISMIYNKSLKLSTFGRKNYSTGEISNIMSVDSQKFSDFLLSINQLWSAPLTFAFAIYMLWQQMGVASLAGVVFMIVLVPFNAWISRKIRNRHMQVMKQKDGRAKMMNEILNGMKVLKLYAWENSFKDKIINLRGLEVAQMYKIAFFMGFMFFALSTAPFLVALLTFGIYVLMGNSLDPNKAFVSLSLFNIIRGPMGFLPMILSNGAMALVSMKRINKFLNEEEINESSIDYRPNPTYAISVQNGTFTWNRDASSATIRNINLDIPHGKLIALVGNVGSGKSSLLSGILGEMEKVSGSINVSGSVAYVPQQAWIQNAILRKNITFTSGFDERKYQNVIKACCLEPDLAILADGDQTEIGERGINLSGGQKQRISLARAVYSDSDIYLLDDPLSAVDAHVGKDLFDDVISSRGLLHDKTRILATHRISVLNQVDEIFVMKDGQIAERGTMNELIERKGDFADYLAEYLQEKHVDSEDDKTLLEYDEDEVEFLEHLTNKLGSIKKLNASVRSKSSNKSLRQRKDSKILLEKPKQNKSTSKGKLITSESTEKGSVTANVYFKYFRTIGWGIILMATLCLFGQVGFQIVTSLWLSAWSDDGRKPENANNTSLRNKRLAGYASFGLGECIFSLIVVNSMNVAAMRASKLLHNSMISKIMHAPMAFFDSTPVGRILNRFTKDVDVADFSLGLTMRMTAMQFLRTIVSFVIISLETPIILAAIVPILIVYYFVQRLYIASSRQLKRIESTTRSPIYNHFGETGNGVNSIRAYRVQNEFLRESFRRIDLCNRCTYSSIAAARWLAIRIEFLGYSIVLFAALFAVLYRETLSPGMAALAISYSLDITSTVGMVIKFASDLETNIVSIERLIEYTEVESEAPYYAEQNRPTIQWPTHGKIHFEGYNTRYRDGLDLVVKDVIFEIRSQEKVGIVGRTGAGKSSLTLALFRIIEAAGGRILIDGIDIGKLGLYDLRSRITIIPQDPVLFTGTLRMNLDPFETYSEQEIWRSLELAHLKQFAQNVEGKLDYKITEGGENLSVGQRQLVCLARALLRKSKILVLDEATAAVDMETDSLIQETIRNEFSDCTIVTIAHRLNTVIDYDRILVLEQGRVQEYDSPAVLLQDQSSMFHSMAKDANLL